MYIYIYMYIYIHYSYHYIYIIKYMYIYIDYVDRQNIGAYWSHFYWMLCFYPENDPITSRFLFLN